MPFLYSAVNLLTDSTLNDTSTEDAIYIDDYLYDSRPSRPFYFTAKAAQWVRVDFGGAQALTLAACFNHNFTSGGATLTLKHFSDAWITEDFNLPFTWREHDFYSLLNSSARYWSFNVSDGANPEFPRIGDLWLGAWSRFTGAHVQPVREDAPEVFAVEQITPYGQDWDAYLSTSKRFRISIVNINNPAVVDQFETFIDAIGGPAGRWVFIPDSTKPHVYLVKIVGNPFAIRPIYGTKELREWSFELKVLTRGITLL
jgi:hypothetical protein